MENFVRVSFVSSCLFQRRHLCERHEYIHIQNENVFFLATKNFPSTHSSSLPLPAAWWTKRLAIHTVDRIFGERKFFLSFQMTKHYFVDRRSTSRLPIYIQETLQHSFHHTHSLTDFSTFSRNFSTFRLALPSTGELENKKTTVFL